MKKFAIILILFLIGNVSFAAHKHPEKYYQDLWCSTNGGRTEYELKDSTRVDCLTQNYAIEFEFAHKWAESIGQSLYYSSMTGKQPMVVLITKSSLDTRYARRIVKASNGQIKVICIKE